MQLKVFLPSKNVLDLPIKKVIAEDIEGSFCLLPKHIDCVRILIPSILIYQIDDEEKYAAIDEGVLIKCKDIVLISTKNFLEGELGELHKNLEEELRKIDEYEKKAKKVLTELEVDFIKRYMEIKK